MLVLGIVVLAFLVVHLIQFWAKMQLVEIRGVEEVLPPSMGTLFIQEAIQQLGYSGNLYHRLHRIVVPHEPWFLVDVPYYRLGQQRMGKPSEDNRLLVDINRNRALHRSGYCIHSQRPQRLL